MLLQSSLGNRKEAGKARPRKKAHLCLLLVQGGMWVIIGKAKARGSVLGSWGIEDGVEV